VNESEGRNTEHQDTGNSEQNGGNETGKQRREEKTKTHSGTGNLAGDETGGR
jgi:hypothetical protein